MQESSQRLDSFPPSLSTVFKTPLQVRGGMNGFAQVLYVITLQKRNSKPVAVLIIPAAVAHGGKFYICHNYTAFESPFFPSHPSVLVFYLPPPKEKGDVSPFLHRGHCPV